MRVLIAFAGVVLALTLAAPARAQPYGLDAPTPVGPFLDGVLPPRTPQSPSSSSWEVVDAFPNLVLPNTLVIESNPADDRLYVGSRSGVIVSFQNDEQVSSSEPFMDLTDRVAVVWDGGFLGLAFDPDFGTPGSANETTFYAYYSSYCPTAFDGQRYAVDFNGCNPGYPQSSTNGFFDTWLRLSRFQAWFDPVAGVWRGDPDSEEPLFNIRLYNGSHRGGGPVFANDGYLYVAIGDQFRYDTAQDITNNFEGGSMRLAVDVVDNGDGSWTCPPGSHQPIRRMQNVTGHADETTGHQYCIPDDNPWPGLGGENFGEYNSLGHRNPHRIALDPVTGLLWSGEVGESTREEVNVILTGGNYQWPYMEGKTTGVRPKPATVIGTEQPPVIDFERSDARTIIGGYVYRGTRFPELSGLYIAGDYTTDNIWAIDLDINTMTATSQLLTTFPSGALGTFGQDRNGEIYMGDVFASIPLQRLNRIGAPVPDAPATLSQLGALVDTANFVVSDKGVPYDLVPFWSDGAFKQRWLFLPNDGSHDTPGEQIAFSAQGNWGWPIGTVAMKHFELPIDEANPGLRVRLETRFLVMGDDGRPYGLTYRWRPDQSDADLLTVAETGDYTIDLLGGGQRQQTWLFPSRSECLQCHTDAAAGFLGLRTHQQNRDFTYPSTGRSDNQLRTWNSLGMFTPPLVEADIPGYLAGARLDDVTASLEHRARSWLDANCSNCHQPATGNRAAFDARFATPLASQGFVWGNVIDGLGLADPYLVHPGDPLSSVVYLRSQAAGGSPIAMPPLAKELSQGEALDLLWEWILRVDPGQAVAGVGYEYYEETGMSVLPDFDSLTPVATGNATSFDLGVRLRDSDFALRFTGVIDVPTTGSWTFYTRSDDGSQLFIDGALVVDNDGLHKSQELSGAVSLVAGLHTIVVTFFERAGYEDLTASWEGPGTPKQPIPPDVLYSHLPAPGGNQAPQLANPGNQSSAEGAAVLLALAASDADGDLLYFEAAGLPAGLVIDRLTGEISGTLTPGQIGTSAVVASVSDGPEVDVARFDWTVGSTAPPDVTNPGDQTDTEGDVVSLAIVASDPDGDPLAYSAAGLPPGLSIDAATGEISGTLAFGSAGTHAVTVTVSDGIHDTAVSFDWMVAPRPNQAPDVSNPGDQAGSEGDAVSLAIVASDPDGDPLAYSAAGLPPGLSIDPGTGAITGTLAAGSAGTHPVTVTVTDGRDPTAVSFDWVVAAPPNQAPIVTNPGDQAGSEGDVVSLAIVASDPDGDPLAYSAAGLPPGLSIDPGTGAITGTLAAGSSGTYAVTVTVTDGQDPTAVSFDWVVAAPPPPFSVPSETGVLPAVGNGGWTLVPLARSYASMVVIATPQYDASAPPQVVRVRNASGNSFEVQVARMDGSAAPVSTVVHYLVVEEGVYDAASYGATMEAVRYTSTVTDTNRSWVGEARAYARAYGNPVVLGQVMSANDPKPSVFWDRGPSRRDPPSPSALHTGKTVGEDSDRTRADEVVGYVVIEAGGGLLAGRSFQAGLGPDTVRGVAAPASYPLAGPGSASAAIASQAGMDGKDGSWAILYGPLDPSGTSLSLAVDEGTLHDPERKHVTEQVGYLVFE